MNDAPTPAQQQKKKGRHAITPSPNSLSKSEDPPLPINSPVAATNDPPLPTHTPAAATVTASHAAAITAAPTNFAEAFAMLEKAWHTQYPNLHFPMEHLVCVPSHKIMPLAAQVDNRRNAQHEEVDDRFRKLESGKWEMVSSQTLKHFKESHVIVTSLKCLINKQKNSSTPHTRRLYAAFAASHPQVSTINQELHDTLSRYCLLKELEYEIECHADSAEINLDWIDLEKVHKSSPGHTCLDTWVDDLAVEQLVIVHSKIRTSGNLFMQTDGGQKEQEVRLFSFWDFDDNKPRQFWTDVSYNGKKSTEVATGTKASLKLVGHETKQLMGLTGDSGQGTPESTAKALQKGGIWNARAMEDSCGLHDLQSVFRLPIEHYIGDGGLENNNAIQYIHTVFSFFKEVKTRWADMVKVTWVRLNPGTEIPTAADILRALQEPLITRWWTVGCAAAISENNEAVIHKMADGIRKSTLSKDKENTIASNVLRLGGSDWILADTYFIAAIAKSWLDPHMKFYQGCDPNIGVPGYLSFHRLVRYFLQVLDLEKIRDGWETINAFKSFKDKINGMTQEHKPLKREFVRKFVNKMIEQVHKHNKRYLVSVKLVRAVYAEKQTGHIVARLLDGQDIGELDLMTYHSITHNREIDCQKLAQFIKKHLSANDLQTIRSHPAITYHSGPIARIARGDIDIWTSPEQNGLRYHALKAFGAHSSTQHNNERLVKLGALMASTGKEECKVLAYAIASNDFMVEYRDDKKTSDDNVSASIETEMTDGTIKRRERGNYRGLAKVLDFERVVRKKEMQLAKVARTEFSPEEFGKNVSAVRESLVSKTETIRAIENHRKVEKMDEAQDLEKPPNAQMRKVAEDIPPRLLGYFPFSEFRINEAVPRLERELNKRGVEFKAGMNVTAKLELLKKDENKRYEAMVSEELGKRGMSTDGSNLDLNKKLKLLQQDACDNDEILDSIFGIDTTKFFLMLSSST